jgi:hypothetical protein
MIANVRSIAQRPSRSFIATPTGLGQRLHLLGRRALTARDDGTRVSHSSPGRRGLAGDEAHHRLLELARDEGGRFLFGRPADLPDHDHGFRVVVGRKERQRVDEVGADEGVATDADARGLPHPLLGQLVDGLVGERAALRHDADAARPADVAWDDSGLRLARRDDSGAIRTDQAGLLAVHEGPRLQHVDDRNALGDAHGEGDARVGRLHDGVGGGRRRHEDDGGVGSRLAHRVVDAVEDRPPLVRRTALARRDASDDRGTVGRRGLRVKSAFAPGQALDDQPRVIVE